MDLSASSLSFDPPAAKSFTPLSCHGLWEAVIMAAGTPSMADSHANAGVGTTPTDNGSAPPAASPASTAAARHRPRLACRAPRASAHCPAPGPPRTPTGQRARG